MGKGIKKFIDSSEKYLEKLADVIDVQTGATTIDVGAAKDYLELIYKAMQSVKLMAEPATKKGKEVAETNSGSLADRMSRNGAS